MINLFKNLFIACLLILTISSSQAQTFTAKEQIQIRKSFYLLYIFERKSEVHNLLLKNVAFNRIATSRQERLTKANSQCKDVSCLATALLWTPEEIRDAGVELQRLTTGDKSFQELVERLKVEERYPVYSKDADTTFIRKAWQDVTAGINHIYQVYLKGLPPRYPRIDSISFLPSDPAFFKLVKTNLKPVINVGKGNAFYKQPLVIALKALAINGRDEATRYEPLYKDKNAAPFAKSRRINWNGFRYSAILVPGAGPGSSGKAIDTMGEYRCKLAVAAYKKGMAPFIIVSGGHVHPYKTPFCEAIEMKKYIVGKLDVPDSAVIIEPHARHTSTNIRNAERLMYLFNMPPTKPGLIISDQFQSLAIKNMGVRFINELGYIPYKSLERVSNTENVFILSLKAWQQDPQDPLDP
ncbi:DUF218 domain-containing protein [Chitinophaga sp. CF118]|uniref:YdcF family protein n=1 Tax=Chitinophaga sp. CF118 TaxID=1884367 RepID=UPI0008EFD8EE|nr:YdcF family protein [Chitinophaga sp. CF118]SFE54807.1 DUF218 domain-containing protein [Chitinophaga sp. CF118]